LNAGGTFSYRCVLDRLTRPDLEKALANIVGGRGEGGEVDKNNILKPSHSSYLPTYEDGTDSVPKRWHIKFRRRGITQKKAFNIQNMAKI
jgi:hypothetical protein